MVNKTWTGERLETFIYNGNTIEHLHRYAIVKKIISDKKVLDIACGEGYGSFLMSRYASEVIGVDVDILTVEKAKIKYLKSNLKFINGDATQIPLSNNSIDVVVSFETIEHHDKHEKMYQEIKRVLKNTGILIISSPDKKYYTDKRQYKNPHHVKELYFDEFQNLAQKYFKNVRFYNQKVVYGSLIFPVNWDNNNFTAYKGDYKNIYQLNDLEPLYNIAFASDDDIEFNSVSFFDGHEILNNDFQELILKIKNSARYRIGEFLLKPFAFIKKISNTK